MEDHLRGWRVSRFAFLISQGNPMKKLLSLAFGLFLSLHALASNPVIEMKTNMGTIVIELYPEKAPKSVDNFLRYVKDGFYTGTIFHRVIDGFMIQGGGFNEKMEQKATRAPIENEANNGLKNEPGTLAMARTQAPHSASAQFFINLVDNTRLNYPSFDGWGYAVFGKVVKGMEVVNKIGKLNTGPRGPFPSDVPRQAVVIEDIVIKSTAK